MECLGPQCASILLDWLNGRANESVPTRSVGNTQGLLWKATAYQEESPTIRDAPEFEGAIEHLEYAVYRRYENQLTRAERARLDNTIRNALYKVDRFVERQDEAARPAFESRCQAVRETVIQGRDHAERLRRQARNAEQKLSQLGSLTPEGFEEFVAELFEALGYEVRRVGGSGDEGADLSVRKETLIGVVQCKYHTRGVVGSPELQKFLGTVHHTHSHKGFFVTTRTFTLAAEKFVATHPIELIDGPRLVELVREVLGPGAKNEPEPSWF